MAKGNELEAADRLATPVVRDVPSRAIRKVWADKILSGKTAPVMVYVGGAWTMHIVRGNKRVLQVPLGPAPEGRPARSA